MSQIIIPDDNETIEVNGVEFTHQNIFSVIDDFYTRIQNDPVLQVPFKSVHDWPEHIMRLTHFWWAKLGGKPYYFNQYNPVMKHFLAGFNDELLKRWLMIFHSTLDSHLNKEQAQLWKLISSRMGEALSFKNEMVKKEHSKG